MTEADRLGVGVRAALHALDAALAEHRRALAVAASRREAERMARAREVKAAAEAAEAALEQPVARPMRGLRLAETWIEADRVRHPLTDAVRADGRGQRARVTGEGWTARLSIAPGDGPAAAAREASPRLAAAAPAAAERARARFQHVVAAGDRARARLPTTPRSRSPPPTARPPSATPTAPASRRPPPSSPSASARAGPTSRPRSAPPAPASTRRTCTSPPRRPALRLARRLAARRRGRDAARPPRGRPRRGAPGHASLVAELAPDEPLLALASTAAR